jgi:hypothetical protein
MAVNRFYIYKVTFRGEMTDGSNPTDRSKLGKAKRHILTDKKCILFSIVISSVNIHDLKGVTELLIMQSKNDLLLPAPSYL